MNSRISKKTINKLVSGGHICAPQRNTNMPSPYKAFLSDRSFITSQGAGFFFFFLGGGGTIFEKS